MKLIISKSFWQAAALGVLAGMRTASAPVVAGQMLNKHQSQLPKFIKSSGLSLALKTFAIGEFVVDKLPSTPNRIKPAGIAFRCLSGALAGAGIYKASGNNAVTGAIIGSVMAFGSTFGSYFLRKRLVERNHIFDPMMGAVEDALVIGGGIGLVSTA